MTNSRPLRWLVQFPHCPNVGYHTSLGRAAKDWAYWTARVYGGRLLCEYTDGTNEVKGDWSWQRESEPAPVLV